MYSMRLLLFMFVFYPISALLVIAAMVETSVNPNNVFLVSRRWASWHYWCARYILGLHSQIVGTLPQYACIIAIKHEANFETIELLRLFDKPAVIMKKELMRIPLWSKVAKAHGTIPVDREGGGAALRQMLKAAKAALAANRPIIIYPEGRRTPHGESPALKSGLAGLYKMLHVPIVPIALNSGVYLPRKGLGKHGGPITWKIGEAIPPGLPREKMEARVYHAINVLNG